MTFPNAYLVHTFPRRDKQNHHRAISILASILRDGLLLTPEVITVGPEVVGGERRPLVRLYQCRVSFTHTTSQELEDHEREFGCISLLFDERELHGFGAMPVLYIPHADPDADQTSPLNQLGTHFVYRLSEAQDVLAQLAEWEARGKMRDFIDSLPSDRADFRQLGATVKALASLYYTTTREPGDAAGRRSYFLQREWRIIGQIQGSVEQIRMERLLHEEKESIRSIDPEFFDAVVELGDLKKSFVDECLLLKGAGGTSISDAILAIRAPSSLVKDVRSVVESFGNKIPIMEG